MFISEKLAVGLNICLEILKLPIKRDLVLL